MRIWKVAFGFVLALLAFSVQAQSHYQRWAFIDRDDNPDTGCSYAVPDASGRMNIVVGAEVAFCSALYDPESDVALDYRVCLSSGEWWNIYHQLPPPEAHIPVGLNLGEGGSDVIEFGPIHRPAEVSSFLNRYGSNRWKLHFLTVARMQGGEENDWEIVGYDYLGTTLPYGTMAGGVQMVPFASPWTIIALMAAMLAIGAIIARRRPDLLVIVICAATLPVSVATWAATHLLDGQIGDWAGVSGFSDPAGDATNADPAIDIRRAFIEREGDMLYFRIDLTDVEAAP